MDKKITEKCLWPIINGEDLYRRIPIIRKIMGSGAKDTQRLLEAGFRRKLSDISLNAKTGVYILNKLEEDDDIVPSFSTTRLLQMLPGSFLIGGQKHCICFSACGQDEFGIGTISGAIINTESQSVIFSYSGHPVSVLVRMLEYYKIHENKVE